MSISISLVRTLIEEVERCGVAADRFIDAAGLDRTLLQDPNARLELPRYDQVQELALDMTGQPALGLLMGEHATLSAFQVVGYLGAQCRTIREGLGVFFRYHRIVSDCPASHLVERGDDAILIYNFPRTTARCSQLRAEFGVTRLLKLGQMFAGSVRIPREVWFEHGAPPYAAEYQRVFAGRTVRFDQPSTGIVVPRDVLDAVQLHPNAQLFEVLKVQAEALLQKLDGEQTLARQIHDLVVHHFAELEPDMETVARRFGMSSRSLRRRLQGEGRSFSDVVGQAMGELACNILREPTTSIQEAAYRLGFAEVSSFHRAFKRWTGKTPNEFRKQ